jgi:hypothetical protein
MSGETDGEKKVFTYDEAARLLPDVRRLTEAAYREVEALSGKAEVEARLNRWAHEVMSLGIDVKGPWLVDFDNGAGYYCWKYPEEGLQFFHTYEEGFRGRTRIH